MFLAHGFEHFSKETEVGMECDEILGFRNVIALHTR